MIERIELLISESERFNTSGKANLWMPTILESLNRLLNIYKSEQQDHRNLHAEAYGLATIVMDDYNFSEGPLGDKLMDLANDIMKENDNVV